MPDSDRRRLTRYPAGKLSLSVKKTGLLGRFKQATPVKAIDFTRNGMAFSSSLDLEPLDHVELSIRLGDHEAQGVIGLVCAVAASGQSTRYSIEFDYSYNKHMQSPQVAVTLKDIEEVLSDSTSIKEQAPPPIAP